MLLRRGVLQCPGVASPMSGACSIESANALRTFQAFKRRRTFLDSLRECQHTLFQLPFTSSKRLAYGHSVISSKYLARGRSIFLSRLWPLRFAQCGRTLRCPACAAARSGQYPSLYLPRGSGYSVANQKQCRSSNGKLETCRGSSSAVSKPILGSVQP